MSDDSSAARSMGEAVDMAIAALLIITGLINVAPVFGVLSGARIAAIYGVKLEDPNVVILLRHRAVLFGLVGGCMLLSVFVPGMRVTALAVGSVSMVTFIVIALAERPFNHNIQKVIVIDIVGMVAAAAAAILMVLG